jgi:O-antigen/teichoic acid export membrane protein
MLSQAVNAVVIKINHGVLFPAYGNIQLAEPHRLRSVIYRARLGIDVLLIVPIAALMMLGSWVVALLYDARYQDAGWMFQILCVQLIFAAVNSNSEACLVAVGRPQYAVVQNVCRALWIIVGIPVGWSLMEMKGAVWAVALSEVPVALVMYVGLARHRMLLLAYELRSLLFAGFGALSGYGLLRLLA